jgi:hypothetical protein
MISAGDQQMWNSRKFTTMAILGAGLAVAAATPASACGSYGYAGGYGSVGYGGCGSYGYAPVYGYAGGCGSYGYGGGYGSVGYGGCGSYGYAPVYGYAGGCGSYGSVGWGGGCGSYGAVGFGGGYGAYGWGCRSHHRHGHGGYTLSYSNYRQQLLASAYGKRHQQQTKVAAHRGQSLQLVRFTQTER